MGLLEGVIAGLIAHGSASAVTKTHDTIRERSPAGDDVSETFDHTLTRSIEERAEEIDSHGLRNVVRHWGAVTEEIDTYEIVFASEEEALNWIVDEIAEHEWIDLTESEQRELRTILADEYADAVAAFHDHVAENERLQRRFQTDMGTALVEQLDAISQAFDRIAGPTPYEIHDFPAGREAITDTLLAGDPIPFVDRTEVPEEPKPNRYFVLGPSGSGKSRVIVEFIHRLPGDAVNHVLIPDNRMIDPSDAKALAHESFDGDLLLVWENVHRIDEGRENRVLERTLRELDQALAEQGHELYTLLEARSGQLHAVPGNLPADFENKQSLWSGFEQLRVEQLEPDRLRSIIDVMATEFGVALDEQAKDALVERTVDSESAPIYVETALVTARDRITADDIERLAEDVADIWQRQYATLRDEKPQEWHVLAAMKCLYDLKVPRVSRLVRAVFLALFNGDRGRFRTAVEALQNRQWLTVVGDDTVGIDTRYDIHDTQLESVQVRAEDDAYELSELLLRQVESTVPQPWQMGIHINSGAVYLTWDFPSLAADQWRNAVEINPDSAVAHTNYALLLTKISERHKDAEEHYQTAIDINLDFAIAHSNYANLLKDELDRPEDAEQYYQNAIEIDPEYAGAYFNYANLLKDELNQPKDAEDHYQTAIDINPDFAGSYYNYANLLKDELNRPEDAEDHYRKAIEIKPEFANAHYSYANLLKNELERPAEAEDHYQTTINIDPEFARAHSNYATLLKNRLDRPEDAEEHYQTAIEINPELPELHFNYANLLTKDLSRPEKAETHYRIALEIDPEFASAHFNYANLLKTERERPEDAETHYQETIRIDSDHLQAHATYANLLRDEFDKPEDAEEHYQRALEIDPDHAKVHFDYALFLATLDRPEEAGVHLKKAVDIDPEFTDAHVNYAHLLKDELERPAEAEDHYQTTINIDPEHTEAHHNYALLLAGRVESSDEDEQDRLADAEEHFQKAIDLNPESAMIHFNYAHLLENELHRPGDAAEHYRRAIESDPGFAEARYNYASLLFEELRRPGEAREHLEESLDIWINEEQIQNALHDVRELIRVCRSLDDSEAVLENCRLAIDLLDRLDDERDKDALWFESMRALANGSDTEIPSLYLYGIQNTLISNRELAAELFETIWDRREEYEKEFEENIIAAAGVALAAFLQLLENHESRYTADELLTQIDPDALVFPENRVYEYLSGQDSEDHTANLLSQAQEYHNEGNTLAALETKAFAVLHNARQ